MISEDILKYIDSDMYGKMFDMNASLITWYQWEYTFSLSHINHYYRKNMKPESFKIIYEGFKKLFNENKRNIDKCYRSMTFHQWSIDNLISADKDIKNGRFTRYYSGSKLRSCSEEYSFCYLNDYIDIAEQYGGYETYYRIMLEFRDIQILDVNSFKDTHTVEQEVIIPPAQYKVVDRKIRDTIFNKRDVTEINYILSL